MNRRTRSLLDGPSEYEEQRDFTKWVRQLYPNILWTATAGGVRLPIGAAKKLVYTGLDKGVPDILIFEGRGPFVGLAIEMKVEKGGHVRDDQKRWIAELQARGWKVVVAHGKVQAIDAVNYYLALPYNMMKRLEESNDGYKG